MRLINAVFCKEFMSTKHGLDPQQLWAKAVLYYERAYSNVSAPDLFGLLFSIATEFLVKSTVANKSQLLIIDFPRNKTTETIMTILGFAEAGVINSSKFSEILSSLKKIDPEIDVEPLKALGNLRNREIHSGLVAFSADHDWLPGVFVPIERLCKMQGKSLTELIGQEKAEVACKLIGENSIKVKKKVREKVAEAKSVWAALTPDEQSMLTRQSVAGSLLLSHSGYHMVDCPVCASKAMVLGSVLGDAHISHSGDEVIERFTMLPHSFKCSTCGLNLGSHAELLELALGASYVKRRTHDHDDYYGISSPEDDPRDEYDNE